MHRSRINGLLIDCDTDGIRGTARFRAGAPGWPIDPDRAGTRGNDVMFASEGFPKGATTWG